MLLAEAGGLRSHMPAYVKVWGSPCFPKSRGLWSAGEAGAFRMPLVLREASLTPGLTQLPAVNTRARQEEKGLEAGHVLQ